MEDFLKYNLLLLQDRSEMEILEDVVRSLGLNGTSNPYMTEAYSGIDDEFRKLKKCLNEMSLTEVIVESKVTKRKLSELPNG